MVHIATRSIWVEMMVAKKKVNILLYYDGIVLVALHLDTARYLLHTSFCLQKGLVDCCCVSILCLLFAYYYMYSDS